jgi:glycosyltransferase involved in cell wall biosynthesis
VIDDGSTDRTGEIVQSYNDRRLSYTYQENQDAFNTINRGMGEAGGRFIAILNSDDIYTTDRLEKVLLFQNECGADCVFTDVVPISDEGKEFTDPNFGWNKWHQGNRRVYRESGDLYTGFLHGNFMVTTSNLFMRAEAVKNVGNFCSLRYLHEYDYIFRMMLAYPNSVKYMEHDKLLYYRIHSGNTLGEAAIKGRVQDQELIRKYMLARIPEEIRTYVETGSARLVELEQELQEVRQILEPENKSIGVKPATRELINSLTVWFKRKQVNDTVGIRQGRYGIQKICIIVFSCGGGKTTSGCA